MANPRWALAKRVIDIFALFKKNVPKRKQFPQTADKGGEPVLVPVFLKEANKSMRKIRVKKNKKRNEEVFYSTVSVPVVSPHSDEVEIHDVTCQMTEEQLQYMHIYLRSHDLMPPPKSPFMDPNEYLSELNPSIDLLQRAGEGADLRIDEVLRAIAILGHTPVEESMCALARFAESGNSLSKIADLAMAECTELMSIFSKTDKAC